MVSEPRFRLDIVEVHRLKILTHLSLAFVRFTNREVKEHFTALTRSMALEMSLRSGGSEGGGSTHRGAEDQEAEKLRKRVQEAEHQIQQLQASNGSLQKRLEDESRFGDFDPTCTHIEQEQ